MISPRFELSFRYVVFNQSWFLRKIKKDKSDKYKNSYIFECMMLQTLTLKIY